MKWAYERDYIKVYYLKNEDCNEVYPQKVALQSDELEKLRNYSSINESEYYKMIRHYFLFLCFFTGIRITNSQLLTSEDLKLIGGEEILEYSPLKTISQGIIASLPIGNHLKQCLAVLKDYKSTKQQYREEYLLPKISDQVFNRDVKKVCKKAGLDRSVKEIRSVGPNNLTTIRPLWKLITAHTGKRTFITLMAEKGALDRDIAAVTGNKDRRTIQKYIVRNDRAREYVLQLHS